MRRGEAQRGKRQPQALHSKAKLARDTRKPGRRRESDRPTKRLCRFVTAYQVDQFRDIVQHYGLTLDDL